MTTKPTGRGVWWLIAISISMLVIWLIVLGRMRHVRSTSDLHARGPAAAARGRANPPRMGKPSDTAESKLAAEARDPSATNTPIELDAVTFDPDSSRIIRGAEGQLSHIAELMKENSTLKIEIHGYAEATDVQLARARAESVRDALVANGVDPARIFVAASGERSRITITIVER